MEKTYRIGEAASMLNLKPYVLRFWETEFSQINPLRTEKGQRLYTKKDIELLERIRFLLHEQGLTIDGARKMIERGPAPQNKKLQAGYAALGVTPSNNLPLIQECDKKDIQSVLEKAQNTGKSFPDLAKSDGYEAGQALDKKGLMEVKKEYQIFLRSIEKELEETADLLRDSQNTGKFLQ